jgi:uncharacterized protein (TIRG00374 family)
MTDFAEKVPTENDRDLPEELHPRHLVVRAAEVAAVIAVVTIAVSALPGLDEVRMRLQGADAVWIGAVVVAEIGSCAGYLLAFRGTFCAQMSWRLSYDIAMAELAANCLLPAGGAGGLALGVWALRQAGMPTAQVARRTVAFFVITSAPNFLSLIAVALAAFLGILSGPSSVLLTLLPALITAIGVLLVVESPKLLRALASHESSGVPSGPLDRVRSLVHRSLAALADGIDQAVKLLGFHGMGVILGSFAYMAFDIAALGFAFAAVGQVPPFATLVLGYLIGQLGNLIPVPGGIGGTEGALIAVFSLYGVNLTDATAATLAYRLFQLAIPAALGVPAFVALRRKLLRADRPGLVCAPLAVERVTLPVRAHEQ